MTMITIKLFSVTVHIPAPEYSPRWEQLDGGYSVSLGNSDVIAVPPNTWFEVEEAEAAGLLARFGGERKEPSK